MLLIRSLLYQIVLIGSTIFFSTAILLVGWIKPKQVVGWLGRQWGFTNLAALRVICKLHYRIQGIEHLPAANAILLCKHQSAWETIALRAILPLDQAWVLKQELTRIPIFGWALRRFKPIAIDRSAGRRAITKLIRDGQTALDAGRLVIVFPEGTRVAPGTHQPYNIGGALLAERSGRSVVPIAHNAGHFWARRSLLKYPGTIDLVIGPTLSSQGRKAGEINAEVERWIEATVAALPDHPGAETAHLAT